MGAATTVIAVVLPDGKAPEGPVFVFPIAAEIQSQGINGWIRWPGNWYRHLAKKERNRIPALVVSILAHIAAWLNQGPGRKIPSRGFKGSTFHGPNT